MRKETDDAIKKITEGIENISQEILRVKAKKNDIYPTDFKKLNGVPLYYFVRRLIWLTASSKVE